MTCEADMKKPYAKGEYNKFNTEVQYIRLSEGCPNACPYCRESYENPELIVYDIPEIVCNEVKILDMNLLCHPEALEIIKDLGRRKVNNKVIHYELLCGIDYRFLNQELAVALKQSRFINIRLAWDHGFELQKEIKSKTQLLINVGYSPKDIMIFMICNWKTTYEDNLRKVDLCKIWNFQIADCYFDNQLSPNIKPIYWTKEKIKNFRHLVRKHNQMINFRIDPEYKEKEVKMSDVPLTKKVKEYEFERLDKCKCGHSYKTHCYHNNIHQEGQECLASNCKCDKFETIIKKVFLKNEC